jgi:hypothetical protein
VVGPPAPDAPQPQAQPQPATDGAGARKPPKGTTLEVVFAKYPPDAFKCQDAAIEAALILAESTGQNVAVFNTFSHYLGLQHTFQMAGIPKDANVLKTSSGVVFSETGNHFCAIVDGRVYCTATGAKGMPLKDYVEFLKSAYNGTD